MRYVLPDGDTKQLLEEEAAAASMERSLKRPDPHMAEVERERRIVKANTYTLAEKYGLGLYEFEKRRR